METNKKNNWKSYHGHLSVHGLQIILWPTALLVTVRMCVFWEPNYKLTFFYIYIRFSTVLNVFKGICHFDEL